MTLDHALVVGRLRAAGCVYAEDEAILLLQTGAQDLEGMLARRVAGAPLEHLLGWAEFSGLRLAVGPGVFVPRQRTTFLAEKATELLGDATDIVVDLCCGCGSVGAVLAAVAPRLRLHAVDIDPAALTYARRNLSAAVHEGDLYEPLPAALQGRVGVVVANAPHVPTRAINLMPAEARDHEPLVALDGGPDGLDIARRVITSAPEWLRAGGHLLVEVGRHQASPVAALMHAAGLRASVCTDDDRDATVVIGRRY